MKIKIYFLIKYFFTDQKGKLRKSFLFQIVGLFLGSFIIAVTYGIMEGMEYEITEKNRVFNYKHHISKNDIVDSFEYLNSGKKNIAALKYGENDIIVNVNTFNYFENFIDRIEKHLFMTEIKFKEKNNLMIIGEGLSNQYNLRIGDEIKLSDIVDINPITGSCYSEQFMIIGIFSFAFINFDNNNIFIKENANFFKNTNLDYYYDTAFHENDENSSDKEVITILSALNLEKYIYVTLGCFVLLVAAIMIFNNSLILLLEKRKQYKILYAQGISENNILQMTLAIFMSISFIFSTLGYSFSLILEYYNQKLNILKYLFIYSPFKQIPITISFDKYILNLIIVLLLTMLATMLAIKKVKTELEEL